MLLVYLIKKQKIVIVLDEIDGINFGDKMSLIF